MTTPPSTSVAAVVDPIAQSLSAWASAVWTWGMGDSAARPAALFYVLAAICVVGFAFGLFPGVGRPAYQRGRFLTPNEKSFLLALDHALGPGYRVFAQVRLAELVAIRPGGERARRRAFFGIAAKSVDFVICDVLTLEPVVAVEVDDRTHLLPERRERDALVNAVFAEIGLPLLRFRARPSYSSPELAKVMERAGLRVRAPIEGMFA